MKTSSLSLSFLPSVSIAFGHAATELQASYTAATQTLKLSFDHSVRTLRTTSSKALKSGT